jgi:hypothetical protein
LADPRKGFRQWLARAFFVERATAANSEDLQSALNVIEARARFDGPERAVFVRVGAHNGALYLDLADSCWRAIEIDANGWRIVAHAPIPFRRPAGMLALPEPVRGGKIDELRPFLNVSDNDEFVLAVSYELAAMRPRGPYPILDLIGEHGAAKSTFASVLRKLIDPNYAALRALPRDERDLFIAANNAHLLPFDNISWLPDWLSDAFCRLSTGGGFATRELYSDQDEALFDAMRPIILNGMEDFVGKSDLADRSIILALKNITDDKRKPEAEFWAEFERAQPRIMGALLDGVAHGLRQLPETRLTASPRMADFALWGTAYETAFWQSGTFLKAYAQNIDEAFAAMIEADRVAKAVQDFMAARPDLKKQPSLIDQRDEWTGTATDLLQILKTFVSGKLKNKEFPTSARGLSGRLRRAAATLRRVGIEVTFVKDTSSKRTRTIKIVRTEKAQAAADEAKQTEESRTSEGKRPSDSAPTSSDAAPASETEAAEADDPDAWQFNREGDDAAARPEPAAPEAPQDANGSTRSKQASTAAKTNGGEPLMSWEIDGLVARGFTRTELFDDPANPQKYRNILTDPRYERLERFTLGAKTAEPCLQCFEGRARMITFVDRHGRQQTVALHLKCAPIYEESGNLPVEYEAPALEPEPKAKSDGSEPSPRVVPFAPTLAQGRDWIEKANKEEAVEVFLEFALADPTRLSAVDIDALRHLAAGKSGVGLQALSDLLDEQAKRRTAAKDKHRTKNTESATPSAAKPTAAANRPIQLSAGAKASRASTRGKIRARASATAIGRASTVSAAPSSLAHSRSSLPMPDGPIAISSASIPRSGSRGSMLAARSWHPGARPSRRSHPSLSASPPGWPHTRRRSTSATASPSGMPAETADKTREPRLHCADCGLGTIVAGEWYRDNVWQRTKRRHQS